HLAQDALDLFLGRQGGDGVTPAHERRLLLGGRIGRRVGTSAAPQRQPQEGGDAGDQDQAEGVPRREAPPRRGRQRRRRLGRGDDGGPVDHRLGVGLRQRRRPGDRRGDGRRDDGDGQVVAVPGGQRRRQLGRRL